MRAYRLKKANNGQTLVEYALTIVLIAVVSTSAFTSLKDAIVNAYGLSASSLQGGSGPSKPDPTSIPMPIN